MAANDTDLIGELRILTGYSTRVLPKGDFESVLDMARRHIRTRKQIEADWLEADWYENQYREEALFWFSALFSKVATGELDSQTIQVGAIDSRELLAKGNNDVTTWYRHAQQALGNVEPGTDSRTGYGHGSTRVIREDRVYDEDEEAGGSLTGDEL